MLDTQVIALCLTDETFICNSGSALNRHPSHPWRWHTNVMLQNTHALYQLLNLIVGIFASASFNNMTLGKSPAFPAEGSTGESGKCTNFGVLQFLPTTSANQKASEFPLVGSKCPQHSRGSPLLPPAPFCSAESLIRPSEESPHNA